MGLTPASAEELAEALRAASAHSRAVTPVGGGTRSAAGRDLPPGEQLSTRGLDRVIDHVPAELTVTVEAGALTGDLAEQLAAAGQWWPQADVRAGSTVGGTIATAASGRRRLRFSAIRDSLLEVLVATGDGRLVRGGGPTVKGVAGYDLPRLMCGSRGTLGVIARVTLKLSPLPAARSWFGMQGTLAERRHALHALLRDPRRPTALLLAPGTLTVELAGAHEDVHAPEGFATAEEPAEPAGRALVDLGVPPARLGDLVSHLEARGLPYLAEGGVGRCRVAIEQPALVDDLAGWAAELGGHLTVAHGPNDFPNRHWAPPAAEHAIMERLQSAFDPRGILNPADRLVA